MSKVIAVVNQKGGVGKTTTTFNLGYALAEEGKKVLLIDFDPQSSLTVCMGYDDTDSIDNTIAKLMMLAINDEKLPDSKDYIINVGKLDLIPCSIDLSAVDVNLVNAMSREMVLRGILSDIKDGYDYIIIDCSPSLGMLTINALVAADSVLIPVTPEYLSAKGLEILLKNIMRVKKRINPGLEIDGILFTMYAAQMNLTKKVTSDIETVYGDAINIYGNKIPKSVKVGESVLSSKSIIEYAKDNQVATAYKELAKEVIKC